MIRRREEQHDQAYAEETREVRGMADSEITVLGPGARLEGTIESAGSLRIDGQVKGQVNADGDVVLSPQSQVEADIRAENATIGGQFKGNIQVKGKAELARGGRIDGNITCRSLVVQEGGIFNGQSQMDQQSGKGTGAETGSGSQAGQSGAASQTTGAAGGTGAQRDGEAATPSTPGPAAAAAQRTA